MGGAGAQHCAVGGVVVACTSPGSSEPARWMIQTWSRASTDTPIVWPRIHLFGRGFGQSGSTSNRGAWTAAASSAALFSSHADPAPRPATTTRNVAPTQRLRFMCTPLLRFGRVTRLSRDTLDPHPALVNAGTKPTFRQTPPSNVWTRRAARSPVLLPRVAQEARPRAHGHHFAR